MKNIQLLFCALSLLCLSVTSCQKEKGSSDDQKNPFNDVVQRMSGYDLNEEEQRLYDGMVSAEYELAVIRTANYGAVSSDPIKFGGSLSSGSSVDFGALGSFTPNIGDNTYLYYHDELASLYGGTAAFTVEELAQDHQVSYTVPDVIEADRLDAGELVIERAQSNVLTWNADESNSVTGSIVVRIRSYAGDMADGDAVLHEDIILTDDDGSLSIDSYLQDSQISQVWISLVRGNAELVTTEVGEVFVNVRSEDHHVYSVE